MSKSVFITGATGYIGGAVAALLVKKGYKVKGLVRSREKAEKLKKRGIEPILGDLSDSALLKSSAQAADIVVDCADADDEKTVDIFIDALQGSGKIFIHTSGSSIVSDQANGEHSELVFDEELKFVPVPDKRARVAIDRKVLAASQAGVRSFVVCPCLIYGEGAGMHSESQQVPNLIKQAVKSGIVRHVGKGENIWSTIHIEDLANLYLTVIEKAPTSALDCGDFYFAESGEASFKDMAEKIREGLCISKPVEEWPVENAAEHWGFGSAVYALGSNSRIRGERARTQGWQPKRESVLEDIPRCCKHFLAASAK